MIAQLDSEYVRTRPTKVVSRLVSYFAFEGRPLTTRGRWINPFVFGWLHLLTHLPRLRRVEKPIFIIGMGRSGSTVLGKILSVHPEIGFLNEPKAIWHVVHPEEDVIGSYSRDPARYRLGAGDATDEVVERAHRLFGAFLTFTASRRLLDKYPELVFRVPFVRAIFPDARFLLLARNGWQVCRSVSGWSERLGVCEGDDVMDWWGLNRRKWRLLVERVVPEDPAFREAFDDPDRIAELSTQAEMAAVEWIVTMREGLRWLQRLPEDCMLVRYEDLTGEGLGPTLDSILAFCGLESDPKIARYAREILYEPTRHQRVELDPALTPLLEETLERLGYPV